MKDFQTLIATHDGIALAALVREKEVTPTELLDAVLASLDAINPSLNAVAERLDETARLAASTITGHESVLAGVPTLIKDLFMPVRGARMANGSFLFGDYRPDFDGELVGRLRRAGIPIAALCFMTGRDTDPDRRQSMLEDLLQSAQALSHR